MSLTIPVPSSAPPASPTTYSLRSGPTPTPQGLAVLDALTTTDRNLGVIARAGAGKSTLLLSGTDAYTQINPSHQLYLCAYNNPIAKELSDKLTAQGYDWRQAQAGTVHRMGNSLVKYVYRPEIDEHKIWKMIDEIRKNETQSSPYWVYGNLIKQLVSLGKQAAVGCFPELHIGDRNIWYALIDHYDVGDSYTDTEALVDCAIPLYRRSLEVTDRIDFDDMILFPLYRGMRVKYPHDLIMADEAQDLSPARQALIQRFLRPNTGRLVIVGDPKQAIYGFSGADARAMDNLISACSMQTFPLSVTWRCARKIVELAQTLVPDLEAAPNAKEGEILSLPTLDHTKIDPALFPTEGDAILCRNNAPLASLAYALIRGGVPAKILGRKIGEGLMALVQRWQVKTTNALTNKLLDYRDREMARNKERGKENKAADVEDKVATILEIIQEVNRRGRTDVDSVVAFIDRLFSDETRGFVTLSSYHKFKGREARRVYLVEHYSRCPSKAARQEWQLEQEKNLAYVAYTRAREVLVFVG